MIPEWTPLRWPSAWKEPSSLDFLKGSPFNYLLFEAGDLAAVQQAARKAGLQVAQTASLPPSVTILKGEWPGVQAAAKQDDRADAGPTGAPWVDSNGWSIRLASARNPESTVWVDAWPKEKALLTPGHYQLAIADSAAHAGRWLATLEPAVAEGVLNRNPDATQIWKGMCGAAGLFAAHKDWAGYAAAGEIGVISDFAGDNEFFNQELLNLLARAGQQYRILLKDRLAAQPFTGLRALIYADGTPPVPGVATQILDFVAAGGMLITVPKWGELKGATASTGDDHPRYTWHRLGKGRIAMARQDPDDSYVMATDSVVLVSHRHDLVRFWNGGAVGSYYTLAPDRKRAVLHMLFYADRGPEEATVWVSGSYRTARLLTLAGSPPLSVPIKALLGGSEVHLPRLSEYAALQLEL